MPSSDKNSRTIISEFRAVQERITRELGAVPLPRVLDRVAHLSWGSIPLDYKMPRFGATETPPKTGSREGWTLIISEDLKTVSSAILSWAMWREGFLSFLLPHIRQIPEAADLGLYAGIKHGGFHPEERKEIATLWQQISPPKHYQHYVYDAPFGFPFFDRVVSDTFLPRVLIWLNSLRTSTLRPLASTTFTAALEQWMFDTHNPLTSTEIRILSTLPPMKQFSQTQLAERLNLSKSTISQALTRLAQRQLLRLSSFINLPLIGLIPLEVILKITEPQTQRNIIQGFSEIPYIDFISNTQQILLCRFLIPINRVEEFKTWIYEQKTNEGLKQVEIIPDAHLILNWNFSTYLPEIGWPPDFTVLVNQLRAVRSGALESTLSPLKLDSYSYDLLNTNKTFPISLQKEDFAYFRRFYEIFRVTERFVPQPSREIRRAGFQESSHMRYRRRVRKLEKLKVSTHRGFWLQHINLNTIISILVFETQETTEQLFTASKIFPSINGGIMENGNGYLFIYVPNASAVEIYSTLKELIGEMEISAHISIKSTWQATSNFPFPLNSTNYDFRTHEWKWDSKTLTS